MEGLKWILAMFVTFGSMIGMLSVVATVGSDRNRFISQCIAYQTENRCADLWWYKRQDLMSYRSDHGTNAVPPR